MRDAITPLLLIGPFPTWEASGPEFQRGAPTRTAAGSEFFGGSVCLLGKKECRHCVVDQSTATPDGSTSVIYVLSRDVNVVGRYYAVSSHAMGMLMVGIVRAFSAVRCAGFLTKI